jgi:hypothetical protein
LVGLGLSNKSDDFSIVDLSSGINTCREVSKYPVKIVGSVAALWNGVPVICGGSLAVATRYKNIKKQFFSNLHIFYRTITVLYSI